MAKKKILSRRAFLHAGAAAVAGWTVGCTASNTDMPATTTPPLPSPTAFPSPFTPTPAATPTETPLPTPIPVRPTHTPLPPTATAEPTTFAPTLRPSRADLIAHYPRVDRSVVALVRHVGALDGDRVVAAAVLQMLDAAITQLTGLNDALSAWQALFDPAETVGIKVNTISRYTTSPEVVYAVAQRLQEAGVSAEQIIIFDRSVHELSRQGFTINPDGPGVRCQGVGVWESPQDVAGTTQKLHDVLGRCDALINIPAVKEHGISGFTSAMKNHYGTVDQPGQLHGGDCDPYIPALNALPAIRDKTRLIVCDALRICPYNWDQMTPEYTLMMSFDPVASDTLARRLLLDRRAADGKPGAYIEKRSHYLQTAVEMGLGADEAHIETRHLVLG